MNRLEFIRESGAPLGFVDEGENPILTLYETGSAAATSQYGGWWKVRWPHGVPHVKVEGAAPRYVPLQAEEEQHTYVLPKEIRDLGSMAGLLRFYALQDGAYTPLEPPLYVQPGSLTEKEYHELIRRIGQIAVAVESAFMAPVGTQAGLGKGQARADARLRPALVYLDLFKTVKQQWALIESQPSRTLCHEPRTVDIRRGIRQPAVARAMARQPERQSVQALMLAETTVTVENEMVAYVLEKILVDRAPAIIDYLEELAASDKQWDVPADFKSNVGSKAHELSERATEHFVEIERAKEWAVAQRRSPLLRDVPSRPPRALTARMARSAQYGPVYAALQRYDREQVPSLRSEPHGVIKALRERAIRKSSELYELWVLFETYAQLVLSFGFRPPAGALSLFDIARVEGGHLSVQEGAEAELHWEIPSQQGSGLHINLRLGFDQLRDAEKWPGGKLKPDLWLEVRVNERTPVFFAIDAKYRRYKNINADRLLPRDQTAEEYRGDAYFVDLLYTARKKYLEALGTTAAFIVHSDPAFGGGWPVEATYWGDRQMKDLSGGKAQPGADEFVAHRFGSIFASPGPRGSASIERLLRCLLVYHVGLDEVCWSCRSWVEPQPVDNKGAANEEGVGLAYQCCGRFWIVTNCMGRPVGEVIQKHRLVKFGRDSFHRTKPGEPWSCVCPECGDLFGAEAPKKVKRQCPKCHGTGYLPHYAEWWNGVCFGPWGKHCDGGYITDYPEVENAVSVKRRLANWRLRRSHSPSRTNKQG